MISQSSAKMDNKIVGWTWCHSSFSTNLWLGKQNSLKWESLPGAPSDCKSFTTPVVQPKKCKEHKMNNRERRNPKILAKKVHITKFLGCSDYMCHSSMFWGVFSVLSQFHVLGGVLCSFCLRAVLPWWYSHYVQHDVLSNLVQRVWVCSYPAHLMGEIWLWSTCKVGKCKRIMFMLNANYLYLYYCSWTRFKKQNFHRKRA